MRRYKSAGANTVRPLIPIALCVFLLSGCVSVDPFPTPVLSPDPSPEVTETEPYLPENPTPVDPPVIPPPDFPTSSGDVTPPEATPEWSDNNLAIDTLSYQNDFTDGGVVRLPAFGVFPQTGDAVIDGYYERCRDDFERMCGELAEDAKSDAAVYQCNAEYFVECNAGGILSVSRMVHTNTGGAHGMTALICETFSVEEGILLTLDDFFSVGREEYTVRLRGVIERVIDANPERYWADAKEVAAQIFPYDVFCITQNGVSLLFHEYTLGPYTTGIVRIDVPLDEISDIFRLPG
ncbi:MAG: DUF4163 domain-containing protein [Oscillospiraceae bacterium]|nr:DUF4163 domain-containing protein [Oscillospiraceae bacterium]